MDIVPEEYTGWIIAAASLIGVALLTLVGYLYKNRYQLETEPGETPQARSRLSYTQVSSSYYRLDIL